MRFTGDFRLLNIPEAIFKSQVLTPYSDQVRKFGAACPTHVQFILHILSMGVATSQGKKQQQCFVTHYSSVSCVEIQRPYHELLR
jgi:hypothetical protein